MMFRYWWHRLTNHRDWRYVKGSQGMTDEELASYYAARLTHHAETLNSYFMSLDDVPYDVAFEAAKVMRSAALFLKRRPASESEPT